MIKMCNSSFFQKNLVRFTRSNFSRHFINMYIKKFGINTDELTKDPSQYISLNDFFTRDISPDDRPIDENKSVFISPCDGNLSHLGFVSENSKFTIKGKEYSINELLNSKDIERLNGGIYCLIYLSPANYHRFHAMADCKLINQYSLGRTSEPVNEIGLKYGNNPIVKNYRIVQELEDMMGNRFYVIYIGAVNVNSIQIHDNDHYSKGEELGYFQFGSSIMILFPNSLVENLVNANSEINMGQAIFKYM